ncbi:MAG: SPOR domain-containing protein [Betaproteobacteria bacterium]|nr:SPOR domain-containing protein [Betaproteobacteria bacterium]
MYRAGAQPVRWLFFLLLSANAAFALFLYFGPSQGGGETPVQQQISPEKIKVLAQGPQAPAKPVRVPAACVEWGPFAGNEMTRAEAALAALALGERLSQKSVERAVGYWVYVPPLKTRQDADRKIGELKARNVTDYFLVQDSPKWRNAISLGIFSTLEAAENRLAELKEKGVKSAIVGERADLVKHVMFVVREPGEAITAKLVELQKKFPGSELAAEGCN